MKKRALLTSLLVGLSACNSPEQQVDVIYTNGKVYTVNRQQPWAEAFAVKGGKFVAVGSSQQIQTLAGKKTPVVDLNGQFVMPGLQDTHIHTASVSWYGMNLEMDPFQPWPDIVSNIKDYAAANADKPWIFGGNLPWLTATIGEFADVPAHKSVLDQIVADRPMALFDVGGHAILANSRALALAGITADTPDPVGGTIERDENGEPTGVLREVAGNLVTEIINAPDQAAYNDGISQAMQKLHSVGITSMTEAWADGAAMRAFMALQQGGELTMRVTAAIGHPVDLVTPQAKAEVTDMVDNIDRYQGERLQTRYVKYVLDGSAGGQTLVMNDPYEGTDFRGHFRQPVEVVKAEVARLHAKGIGSIIHAVGDGAIRAALDVVENAIALHGDNGVRHSIAHTVFVNPEDLERFAKLGVNAEFSPYIWWPSEGLEVIRHDIGERTEWGFPVKAILERGNHVSAGSDWPVVYDPNPFPAIEALVTREVPGGSEDSFGKQHAITIEQALQIYTLGGAYVNYAEETTGAIAAGKLADFIVLDRNLLNIPTREVHQARVLKAVINGDVVYQR